MKATATLIRKELRQHRAAFWVLAILFFVAYGIWVLLNYFQSGVAGSFSTVARFLSAMLIPAAGLICGRLVVTEYRRRTQLFLEALPLARIHMVLVKYLIGLGLLYFLALAITGVAAWMGMTHEVFTGRFVAILATDVFAACFFWYGFFFVTGFTGRYRIAIWIIVFIGLYYFHENTEWSYWTFGPNALLGDRFGFEREAFNVEALKVTGGFGLGFFLMAMILSLISEGSLAGLMGEKMSIRERVLFTAIIMGLFMASSTLKIPKPPLPYEPPGSVKASLGVVTVRVSGQEEKAQALADRVAGELGALAEALGLAKAPAVFVSPRPDFALWQFERGELLNTEGLLAQGNYERDNFPEDRFVAWIIGEWLDTLPSERATVEEKRWPRAGAGWYWVRRASAREPLAADRDLALRALLATEGHPLTEITLRDWFLTTERLGEDVAEGLAWSGLRTLARAKGEEAVIKLLRQLYVVDLPKDYRAVVMDKPNVPAKVFSQVTGQAYGDFVRSWNAALESERSALAPVLAALPRLALELEFVNEGEDTVAVKYLAKLVNAPAEPTTWRLRWTYLRPFDQIVYEHELYDIWHTTQPGEAMDWRQIPDRFPADDRVYASLTMECPELGGAITSGWQRRFVRPATP